MRNHAPDIAAMDLFVVPTIGFDLLYAFVIVQLGRRDLVWINVTANPTAEWVARQITEAFPWDEAPHYLIRDRDRMYGSVVTRRVRAMGIRDNRQSATVSSTTCFSGVPSAVRVIRSLSLPPFTTPLRTRFSMSKNEHVRDGSVPWVCRSAIHPAR